MSLTTVVAMPDLVVVVVVLDLVVVVVVLDLVGVVVVGVAEVDMVAEVLVMVLDPFAQVSAAPARARAGRELLRAPRR